MPPMFALLNRTLEDLDASGIAQKLTIPERSTGFEIFECPAPEEGLTSPLFRTDPGFVGGGFAGSGAPEFVIPNGPIPPCGIVRTVP